MKRDCLYQTKDGHLEPVTGCAITSSGEIVSISKVDRTIHCYSAEGLELQSIQPLYNRIPIALASTHAGTAVLVGTKEGQVWQQQPNVITPLHTIDQIFAEPVISLFSTSDGSAIIAAESGQVRRKHFVSNKDDILWRARYYQRQHKVLPAGNFGLYWVYYSDINRGQSVLSLVTAPDQETIIWESPGGLSDVAVTSDGSLLCLAGKRIEILKPSLGKWISIYQKDVAVQYATFLNSSELLVVILRIEPWLEIWQVEQNLPTLAAQELPETATCLSVSGNLIVVGLRSGELMSLRFMGELKNQN